MTEKRRVVRVLKVHSLFFFVLLMRKLIKILTPIVGGFLAYAIVGGIGVALLGTAIGIPAIGVGIIVGLLIWLIIRAVR